MAVDVLVAEAATADAISNRCASEEGGPITPAFSIR
jgi:hypothetical protein